LVALEAQKTPRAAALRVQRHASITVAITEEAPPPGQYISSPYDHDARYSQKRGLTWIGYKIHLTESCDADLPHLITNVETTTATTSADAVTARIHEALKQHELFHRSIWPIPATSMPNC
jgi:hypothetical protein